MFAIQTSDISNVRSDKNIAQLIGNFTNTKVITNNNAMHEYLMF